jgi:GAF domain-containing protein
MSSNGGAIAALEQLGRLSLRDQSMDAFLQRVCDLAVEVMPGDLETSVSVVGGKKATTAVFTGQLALDCDERQYEAGDGPCLHAATTGELVEVADMRIETRWPEYMRRAVGHGALSSLSVPLPIAEKVSGALNMYARRPRAFDDESRAVAVQFGPYAAAALANMHAYQDARNMADNLQAALESRAVIDQAKGILMERHRMTADQAFQVLARISMQSNQKLRVVADELVRTGHLPEAPTTGS